MAIRIVRNEAGNCINFEGSSNPSYFNACLSGALDPNNANNVHVINDKITGLTGVEHYEFYSLPFTEFEDKDGNAFTTAQECVDYITANANVTGLSGDGIDLTEQTVCFKLDDTSTSIMLDNGYSYGVNTIKAVENGGVIDIVSNNTESSIKHFHSLNHTNVCVNDVAVAGGLNDVINTLNELFTVGAFESVVISDPYSTMIADVAGVAAGYTLEGSGAIDPVGDDIFTNTSTGNYAGLKSTATIDQAGEYFTFDIRGEGQIGFGLVHTDASYAAGSYQGNATYADPATFAVSNSAHYGYQFSHWFHPTPNGSWTNYGASTGIVYGPGWYNWESQADWLAGNPVKIRVGIDENGFIAISSLQDDNTTWVLHARSSYPVPSGSEFHLGIKSANPAARVYTAPMVHLLEIDSTPVVIGDDSIDVFGSGISGTLSGGIIATGVADDNDGIITAETISSAGEYFEWTWSVGDANVGLFSENDHNVSDPQGDTSVWGNDDYIFYGTRQENNGVLAGFYSDANLTRTVTGSQSGSYYGRVGFDLQGRPFVAQSTDGITWQTYHHGNAAAPTGDYKFIWVAQNDNCDIASFSKGQLDAAPTMYFRYIESPDGVYTYPLFATQEEAEYYDQNHDGTTGSGTYTTLMYPDDPTNTLWYKADTGVVDDASAAPSGVTFDSNPVNYTEITSLDNADLVPTAYADTTVTVNELSSVNIQTQPADTAYTTTFSGLGTLIADGFGGITGTAPEVTGDNVANPSDTLTITVTRTNNYGSSTGTLTLVVTNLTAPVITPITGFTHVAGSTALIDSSTMDDGSVINMDETLLNFERFIIPSSYVETNILPSILQTGGSYYIGVLNTGADVSSVTDADWDVAFVWEYQTATTHRYKVIKDGVQQWSVGVGSNTVALFDYAIEAHTDHAYMIACNLNAINTEPSPEFGGTFTNATEVALDETLPVTISFAYTGSDSADFSTTGLSEIVTPAPDDWIQVDAPTSNTLNFDGSATMPTLQAGYTYRFLMGNKEYADLNTATGLAATDVLRFTADGSTEYTTGITRVGSPADVGFGADTAYVVFSVPTDVPPLQWYTDANTISSLNTVTTTGSTHTVDITGITLEGPAANQTGTNITDNGDYGWMSIDETVGAGQRFVMNNAFFTDLLAEMGDQYEIRIGLKGDNWDNTDQSTSSNSVVSGEVFKGDLQLRIYQSTGDNIYFEIFKSGTSYNSMYINTAALQATMCAFIEVTSSGNNIRMGFGRNGSFSIAQGDESTKTYSNWGGYKGETGDQGFGITSLDVVFLVTDIFNGAGADYDGANVDWTNLSEVTVPTPPVVNTTDWTKAVDFSGGSERLEQSATGPGLTPLKMGNVSTTCAAPASAGDTSNDGQARPWATAAVFQADRNSSNQHIWNLGEGAGTTDDNIYLRLDANGQVYFGWGRQAAFNECEVAVIPHSSSGRYWGVYVAHNGTRLSATDATATNLAAAFDIRVMTNNGNDDFATLGSNQSTSANWVTTGGRMDRQFDGNLTIGGRGSNRTFHGKVASMVSTTLNRNVAMPTDAEIELMITDPEKWLVDYKVGQTYRQSSTYFTNTFAMEDNFSSYATQVWLMGDGSLDSYANGIRNRVASSSNTNNRMQFNSMVSNDIENVTISGLS